jgi:transcriptional regulator with PAS, ATPase and Fis domain
VKGAFTGAATNKKGFFEAASDGTIFLDEVAEMSLATQQRLLRVLQEGTVRPVSSTEAKEIEIDTRFRNARFLLLV